MYCQRCGAQILESALFCIKCGNAVGVIKENQSEYYMTDSAGNIIQRVYAVPKKKRRIFKKIISVFAVLTIISAGLYLVYDYFYSAPEKTLKNFEKAVNSADLNGMIECMDPSVQAAYKGMDFVTEKLIGFKYSDFAKMAPFLSEIIDDEDMIRASDLPKIHIEVDHIEYISDNTAVVYAYITYDGEREYGEIYMKKDDGQWYMSSGSDISLF